MYAAEFIVKLWEKSDDLENTQFPFNKALTVESKVKVSPYIYIFKSIKAFV